MVRPAQMWQHAACRVRQAEGRGIAIVSNDDERTVIVSRAAIQPTTPKLAPGTDAAPTSVADSHAEAADKTVIMKPSQRARDAAAALSEDRRRALENTRPPVPPATVDFDVTTDSGLKPPPLPAKSGPNWMLIVGAIALAGLLVVIFLV